MAALTMCYHTDVSFCRGQLFSIAIQNGNYNLSSASMLPHWSNRNAHILKAFLRSKGKFQWWVLKNPDCQFGFSCTYNTVSGNIFFFYVQRWCNV